MRSLRTFVLGSMVAFALSLVVGPGSAAAAQCSTGSDGQRWCNASADAHPTVKGWYGYVGHGGGPCGGGNPRGTTFASGIGGACVMPQPVVVWKWNGTGWSTAMLADGTRGYVHPYVTGWRWLYANRSWYAISSKSLTLEWRVS